MKYSFRQASLDIWELKGPPESWQSQLAAYSSKKPVFAVLGGISNSSWQPVHDFCEAERLPCLFPVTPFPVVSETSWYTYYFDKGFSQEGEGVARYLNRLESLPPGAKILQIVQDSPAGRALAAGFDNSWRELEQPLVKTVTMSAAELADGAALDRLIKKEQPAVLLLWTGPELLPRLPAIAAGLEGRTPVFVSSGYLGKQTAAIPEAIRPRVFITWPWRLTPYVGPKTGGIDSRTPILASARDFGDRRIASRTLSALQQATLRSLSLLYDNLQRDNLLDIMSMSMDLVVKDYERLSFGPGQRYVSKGCYIIQLGPGEDPPLLPRSEWVIH